MFHKRENFTSDILFSKRKPHLMFLKLSALDLSINDETGNLNNPEHHKWLIQAAEWAECKWGYMRIFPGIRERMEIILAKEKYFYLALYKQHLVGMFSLTPNQVNIEKETKFLKNKNYYVEPVQGIQTINLSYFYVHDNFREFGFGTQMLNKARQLAREANMLMTAHLLTPNVHGFYAKRDAVFVDEDRSLKEPCTLIHFGKK